MARSGVRYGVEWLQDLASRRNGECLSSTYVNSKTKYVWKCSAGDIWESLANDVQQGHWCPHCHNRIRGDSRRKQLEWLRDLASGRGGRCLSTKYINYDTKYRWMCDRGHTWESTAHTINQGCWCLRCSGSEPHDLQWLQDLAAQRGGKCLATEYRGMSSKYLWECPGGKIWTAKANSIQQGRWCLHCSSLNSKKEESVFEYVRKLFPDAERGRRGLLRNKRFELDIWVPSLARAIEFDGWFWHQSLWAAEQGAPARDSEKNLQCDKAGIRLLRIQERDFDKDSESIFKQIESFLRAP